MRIAVVSNDGIHVNEHFGKAEKFFIYDVADSGLTLIGERPSLPLSVNDPDHPFDPYLFGKIVQVIQDCENVYVTQIGKIPSAKLKERGIEPRIFDGLITDISG